MLELRIQQIDRVCLFDLSWGQGNRISQTHTFPEALTTLYQQWQQAYTIYYRTVQIPVVAADPSFRGQKVGSGTLTPSQQVDWHGALIEAETRLLWEFHRWLRHEALYEIRERIAQMSQAADQAGVDLFLTCTPLNLARLPWETWEIGAEFGAGKRVRMIRTSANVREKPSTVSKRRTRPRVLAILGDDTGLDFQADKAAVKSLDKVAEVKFVGWQPGKAVSALRTEIGQAIADPQGWDVLFFAGHSNETALTGGELGIAPNATIRISELEPKLLIAKERGLQFALFNSCNGLSLAESLIDMGLSQVAVMREPVHDRVAHEFLVQFMQSLAEHKDVHEAVLNACQFLKVEANLTYPSAYLIPSLFRHPQVSLFRIPLPARQRWIRHWIPKRYEAIALTGLLALSLLPPVQDRLLDRRVWMQAQYRQMMKFNPSARGSGNATDQVPPTLLVRIDDESISKDQVEQIHPFMDRRYLARIVDRLSALNAKVIGLDYVLDYSQAEGEQALVDAIRRASKTTKFVFATAYGNHTLLQAKPEFTNAAWSVSGAIEGIPYYTTLIDQVGDGRIPFPYWLAWLYRCCIERSSIALEPIEQVADGRLNPDQTRLVTSRMHSSGLTQLSYGLWQMWFHPILDYSLPPKQVYTEIPAWKLLQQSDAPELKKLSRQVVIVAPGGYATAGVKEVGQDTFPAPSAMTYWYVQENPDDIDRQITGGENHAYVLQHLLSRRLVVPIPDLWLILLAAFLGRGTVLWLGERLSKTQRWITLLLLVNGTILYSVISLQIYLSPGAILIPIVLPVATYWLYVSPALIQRRL